LLAERLLGQALSLSPDLVQGLARQALAEVRAARRVRLVANPEDVPGLAASISNFDPEGRVHDVVADADLARGDLRLETELGTVNAHVGEELPRLAARLREALRS
jgi:flagellar biosynthesis/type III secretory pathway protein FliH